jgi:protein gp37
MRELLRSMLQALSSETHIWWGVSVENRRDGLPRIEHLRHSPAAVRFLSVEPLLEDLGTLNLSGISWVILGGESGHGARPMQKEWAQSIRDQCRHAGVPFFFKQWGGIQKGRAGRALDGRTHDEVPARSRHPISPPAVRSEHIRAIEKQVFATFLGDRSASQAI